MKAGMGESGTTGKARYEGVEKVRMRKDTISRLTQKIEEKRKDRKKKVKQNSCIFLKSNLFFFLNFV